MVHEMIPIEMYREKSKGSDAVEINIDGNFEWIAKSESERIIAGYASVAIVDSENDLITLEALEEGLKTLLEEDGFYANLMVSHSSIQIGRILKEYGEYKTHVDSKGLFLVCKIRNDTETANEVWKKILSGEINGFSIGGEVLGKRNICNDEMCWTEINKINLYEVSVTSSPVNKSSTFVIVSKSNSRYFDNCEDVCNVEKSEDDNSDTMAKAKETKLCEEKLKELSGMMDEIKDFLLKNPDATTEEAIKSLYNEITTETDNTENTEKQDDEVTDKEEEEEVTEEEIEEEEEKEKEKFDEEPTNDEDVETEEKEEEPIKTKEEQIIELVKSIISDYGFTISKQDEISDIRKEWEEFKRDINDKVDFIKSIDEKNKELEELKQSNEELKDEIGSLQKSNEEYKSKIEKLEKEEIESKITVKTITKSEDDEPIYIPKYYL